MTTETQKVDVLAVMDACIDNVVHEYSMAPANPEQVAAMLIEARAAVAELIEITDRVAGFLVGHGDVADMCASHLRKALARFGGAA